jgi:chaperonin GroES
MSNKVVPRNDRVVIIPQWEDTRLKNSKIVIPDTAKKDYPAEGTVHDVGPDVTDLKKGDQVLFAKYAGDDVEIDGIPYKIVREESVLASVTPE